MKRRAADIGKSAAKAACTEAVPQEAWDCPICSKALIGRIFQCQLGHHICESCLNRIRGESQQCPSCRTRFPATPVRNLAMEQIISNVSLPCEWKCGFSGKPDVLKDHQQFCPRRHVGCPLGRCSHQCAPADMLEHLEGEQHQGDFDKVAGFKWVGVSRNEVLIGPDNNEDLTLLKGPRGLWALLQLWADRDRAVCVKVVHIVRPVMFQFRVYAEDRADLGDILLRTPSEPMGTWRSGNTLEPTFKLAPDLFDRYIHERGPDDFSDSDNDEDRAKKYKVDIEFSIKAL